MYILAIDESNTTRHTPYAKFFVVGGLLINTSKLKPIMDGINSILTKNTFTSADELKYSNAKYPKEIKDNNVICNQIRNEVVDFIITSESTLFLYLVSHAIIERKKQNSKKQNNCLISENIEFGINTILSKVNQLLQSKNEICLVLIDKHQNLETFVDNKLLDGLHIPLNQHFEIRDNIISISTAASHGSFVITAVDMVIGAFRFAINNLNHQESKIMIKKLEPLFYKKNNSCIDNGIAFYPKNKFIGDEEIQELLKIFSELEIE